MTFIKGYSNIILTGSIGLQNDLYCNTTRDDWFDFSGLTRSIGNGTETLDLSVYNVVLGVSLLSFVILVICVLLTSCWLERYSKKVNGFCSCFCCSFLLVICGCLFIICALLGVISVVVLFIALDDMCDPVIYYSSVVIAYVFWGVFFIVWVSYLYICLIPCCIRICS